ncbi:hypothetical protein ACJQ40_001965 [Enterococcus faecium]|nr:hypothetical protein [Enterococcus faecium]
MKTAKGKIIEETFYLGNHHITIVNANYYFPDEMTEEAKEYFFEKNDFLFSQAFRQLADASRDFYAYGHNFEIQKKVIEEYLASTQTNVIVKETGMSPTSINKLKKNKKELETKKFQTIEKLYQMAVKKRATLNERQLIENSEEDFYEYKRNNQLLTRI